MMPYAGNTDNPPDGWLYCRGQELKIEEYTGLYNAIGFTYTPQEKQGLDVFNVPDTRGMFLRGFDAGAQVDTGREFGTEQGDGVPAFWGKFNMTTSGQQAQGSVQVLTTTEIRMLQLNVNHYNGVNGYRIDPALTSAAYQDLTEVRVKNLAVNYIIKI